MFDALRLSIEVLMEVLLEVFMDVAVDITSRTELFIKLTGGMEFKV